MKSKKDNGKSVKGITAEKDEFSEWFTQIMLKTDLADYTRVSGCIILKPKAWQMWEKIVYECNKRFKKLGVENVYFPLFIPEEYLNMEKEHVKGFSPEVAWVTHVGNTKLNERLAIRPTSEAIMYPSFAKWIRSYKDLPLKYNQWSNVVRWEFKNPIPFLRTREFWFNEGHTVYATSKEAESEKDKIISLYKEICEDFMALPSLIGKKTNKEKFAGAVYTVSMEFLMPNGKAIQGPDFHFDGQNFAKAYDIKFLDENENTQFPWQNTWAISTRMLGVMFAIHSDDKGLILPPKMAPNKVVIVPIFNDSSKREILSMAEKIKKDLSGFDAMLDDREDYRPGFKFNEYEMKGIPVRIEIGPRDLAKKQVVLVRRDTGDKSFVKVSGLKGEVESVLEDIQNELFRRAKKKLKEGVVEVSSLKSLEKVIKDKKIGLVNMCNKEKCEDDLKFKTGGVKVLNINGSLKAKGKCLVCGKGADYVGRVGKSY